MRRKLTIPGLPAQIVLIILLAFLCFFAITQSHFISSAKPENKPEFKNVILICWDGVEILHLERLLERNEMPNLSLLKKAGGFGLINVPKDYPSETKPSIASALTGLPPEYTLVYSNSRYNPIPCGYTLFEVLESHLGDNNITTIFIAGEAEEMERSGEIFSLNRKQIDFFASPKPNQSVCERFIEIYEKFTFSSFFAFLHIAETDKAGHLRKCRGHIEALRKADQNLGHIIQLLKKHKIYKNTLIYVFTDHSRDHQNKCQTHHNSYFSFLCTNDVKINTSIKDGSLYDIFPTILSKFGIDFKRLSPLRKGKVLLKK